MADVTIRIDGGMNSLRAEVWKFWFYKDRMMLVLNEYYVEVRPSLRHKWRIHGWFDRTNSRDCSIKEKDAPLPDTVKAAAIKYVMGKLRVVKWSEVSND